MTLWNFQDKKKNYMKSTNVILVMINLAGGEHRVRLDWTYY